MSRPVSVLHFADAHIDIANYGRHDPETALPVRVVDFLRALDQIIETAVSQPVDLVIFAGDAYKDRNPQPTFQREWGRRIMRLSQAGIPTILLVGNHDVSPASGRAHTLHEFSTLGVPHVHVADRIRLLGPDELGVPVQVITVPWVSRSQLLTRQEMANRNLNEILQLLEERVHVSVQKCMENADPALPLILTAHASVQGARYGSERNVMLGQELTLSGNLVADKRLDYVALGHIHKHQALHADGTHPPIVYSGSIERIDFGEAREKKGFVLAQVTRGHTEWEFVPLPGRRFIDLNLETPTSDTFMDDILRQLPAEEDVKDAICRIRLTYPRDWESLLDERVIRERFKGAFSVQIDKHYQLEKRSRLGETADVEALSPEELLDLYWATIELSEEEAEAMRALSREVLASVELAE
ncbi:MAG: exonuclease SbcCD subunit D [Chloroflexi bacterium]|nr:MAG: exonuclease SbcCD subunit D [Chloroflexota bacterium]